MNNVGDSIDTIILTIVDQPQFNNTIANYKKKRTSLKTTLNVYHLAIILYYWMKSTIVMIGVAMFERYII